MNKEQRKEKRFHMIVLILSLISLISLFLILVSIFKSAFPFLKDYGLWNFISGRHWKPSNTPASYGILPMIVASLLMTLVALVVAFPFGVGSAIFLAFYAKGKWKDRLVTAINIMSGVPSVVFGFFALMWMVPLMRELTGTGLSGLTGGLLLAIMILPIIINISFHALEAVPKTYYQNSLALGASHEQTVFKVMLPAAKSGVLSSLILGTGRAIGETMAIVLVAGNQPIMPHSLNQGMRSMTANIVMDMAYAQGEHQSALFATGAVLFIFILLINLGFSMVKRGKDE